MEWVGWLAFILLLCYSSYPGKVRQLEAKMKKMERKQKGESDMSRIINDLVQKRCKLKTDEALAFVGSTEIECDVLDADDEWIKIAFVDKKNIKKIKILRIEKIDDIELTEEKNSL